MVSSAPLSLPTSLQPITEEGQSISQVWYRFLQSLMKRSAATVPYLTGTGLTATGTVQGDALVLENEWNEVTTVAANSGVLLFPFGVGLNSWVWNLGANALDVYPPLGCAIDALGNNNPYILATSKVQIFHQLSETQFRSLQLG